MSDFGRSLAFTLQWEGGYTADPRDPGNADGGATNYGITQAVAAAHGYTGDMRAIPMQLVHTIYRTSYWDRICGDDLPWPVNLAVFDYAVNSGVSRAAKALQAAVGAAQDGAIGTITLRKVAQAHPVSLARAICAGRLVFLRTLKTWPVFGKGWERRVHDLEREIG